MSSDQPLSETSLKHALLNGSNEGQLIARVPVELSYCEQCERWSDIRSGCETDIRADERDRIRTELIDWLIGTILPCDAGLINGRRIVDEIDRICPKE